VPARGYAVDMREWERVAGLIDAIAHDFGRIDHLVNNAGVQFVSRSPSFRSTSVNSSGHRSRRGFLCDQGRLAASPGEALDRAFVSSMPSRRFVEPAEVGALCAYLCGDSAKSITGAPIPIDGGWVAQ
jgi:NAD(P)-dependent dehydrogenase (short-subunit alcohol dehydrogenase family)